MSMTRLMPVLLLALLAVAASAQVISTDLRFGDGNGAIIAPYGAAIGFAALAARDSDIIAVEAEDASVLTFQNNRIFSEDSQASGGRYIANVARAEYNLTIKSAGRYQGWARIFYRGRAAGIMRNHSMRRVRKGSMTAHAGFSESGYGANSASTI